MLCIAIGHREMRHDATMRAAIGLEIGETLRQMSREIDERLGWTRREAGAR
jgi:hypothetical protein